VDTGAGPTVPAVPVQAQHGGIVAECVAGRVEATVGQGADCLPRMQRPSLEDRGGKVDRVGISLEHAVGEEDHPVTRLQIEMTGAKGGVPEKAEGDVRGEVEAGGLLTPAT
jgi:hypothetical protein